MTCFWRKLCFGPKFGPCKSEGFVIKIATNNHRDVCIFGKMWGGDSYTWGIATEKQQKLNGRQEHKLCNHSYRSPATWICLPIGRAKGTVGPTTSWWFFTNPFWQNMRKSNWNISPQIAMNMKSHWNHHIQTSWIKPKLWVFIVM